MGCREENRAKANLVLILVQVCEASKHTFSEVVTELNRIMNSKQSIKQLRVSHLPVGLRETPIHVKDLFKLRSNLEMIVIRNL